MSTLTPISNNNNNTRSATGGVGGGKMILNPVKNSAQIGNMTNFPNTKNEENTKNEAIEIRKVTSKINIVSQG